MFSNPYFLLFLLLLSCELTNTTDQNALSPSNNNYKQRIKRFKVRNFFESKSKSEKQSKNKQQNDISVVDRLVGSKENEKQSQSEPDQGYTQPELSEIKRILSRKENDYYGILGIKQQATTEEITKAFQDLARRVHPDKTNVPGATEAAQRLVRARQVLLKKFQDPNQNDDEQTARTFTTPSSTFDENENEEVSDIIDESDLTTTFSPSPSKENKKPSQSSSLYLLVVATILIIGIIIFIIYWKKRRLQSSTLSHRNKSKKRNILPTSASPESNDGDTITINSDSEISIVGNE